jgi:hypothetical protein
MTPKEKAKELMLKYYDLIEMSTVSFSKQCALIAVDEILKIIPKFEYGQGEKTTTKEYDYWEEVKQEIEKL